MSLEGKDLSPDIYFKPGLEKTYRFSFRQVEYNVGDFFIDDYVVKGKNLMDFVEVNPRTFENVKLQERRSFSITVKLPQKSNLTGIHETWIKVQGKPKKREGAGTGVQGAVSVAVRMVFYFPSPNKRLEWDFKTKNANIEELVDFTIHLQNMGVPFIKKASASIDIIDADNNIIRTLKTDSVSLQTWDEKTLVAPLDTTGFQPGNYQARATLFFDELKENKSRGFRIGTLRIDVHNITREFVSESINKMNIDVESFWNNAIDDLTSTIEIRDTPNGEVLKKVISLTTNLRPWQRKGLEAYFDTTGLELGEYLARVTLNKGGGELDAKILIKESANTETFEEIPKKNTGFSLYGRTSIIVVFLIIATIINLLFLLKKKKKEPGRESLKKHIKKSLQNMSQKDIRKQLIETGWDKKEVDEAFDEILK